MSDSRRISLGIQSAAHVEALERLKGDLKYLKTCFSDELIETYLMIKEGETKKVSEKSKSHNSCTVLISDFLDSHCHDGY